MNREAFNIQNISSPKLPSSCCCLRIDSLLNPCNNQFLISTNDQSLSNRCPLLPCFMQNACLLWMALYGFDTRVYNAHTCIPFPFSFQHQQQRQRQRQWATVRRHQLRKSQQQVTNQREAVLECFCIIILSFGSPSFPLPSFCLSSAAHRVEYFYLCTPFP